MKVLMFGWEFPPHISGGLGTACYGIVTGLLQQGVQVTFVVPRLYGEENKAFRLVSASEVFVDLEEPVAKKWQDLLKVVEVESPLSPYVSAEEPEVITESADHTTFTAPERRKFTMSGKYGKDLLHEVYRYGLIASQIAKEQPHDVIHAHDWLTFNAGLAAKEVGGKPLIVHVHATEYDRAGEHVNKAVFNIEKEGMEKADHIIAVSGYTRQMIIDRYGISGDKVSVAHNGILPKGGFPSPLEKNLDEKIVTFMGRITHQKGPEYFVEAAAKVLKKMPNVRFVMAGSGDMMDKMIERVAQLELSSRFHFTGFLKGDDVDQMYAMSDIYVMPSVSEPFGIAPLEAIEADVPVIISKQSGVSEVLNHVIKVDFWNVDELADAIFALLQYTTLSSMFKNNGKSDLKELKWENTSAKIKEVYKTVMMN